LSPKTLARWLGRKPLLYPRIIDKKDGEREIGGAVFRCCFRTHLEPNLSVASHQGGSMTLQLTAVDKSLGDEVWLRGISNFGQFQSLCAMSKLSKLFYWPTAVFVEWCCSKVGYICLFCVC
jgi:hypothetical protein